MSSVEQQKYYLYRKQMSFEGNRAARWGSVGVGPRRTIVVDPRYALKVSLTSTALSRVAQYSSTPKNSEGSAALLLSAALILVSWATHHSESSPGGHL
jgi:hypothetical protein